MGPLHVHTDAQCVCAHDAQCLYMASLMCGVLLGSLWVPWHGLLRDCGVLSPCHQALICLLIGLLRTLLAFYTLITFYALLVHRCLHPAPLLVRCCITIICGTSVVLCLSSTCHRAAGGCCGYKVWDRDHGLYCCTPSPTTLKDSLQNHSSEVGDRLLSTSQPGCHVFRVMHLRRHTSKGLYGVIRNFSTAHALMRFFGSLLKYGTGILKPPSLTGTNVLPSTLNTTQLVYKLVAKPAPPVSVENSRTWKMPTPSSVTTTHFV
mmetsp:Transcript_78660/g.156389  ORF Transcript_78660/g.156389 Transcript_78660/m.156389 type:complete len:263 (-) Transcript_78660:153-941(-)